MGPGAPGVSGPCPLLQSVLPDLTSPGSTAGQPVRARFAPGLVEFPALALGPGELPAMQKDSRGFAEEAEFWW